MTHMEVRFRLGPTKRWRYGKIRWGLDDSLPYGDGYVTLIDHLTGGTRTISAKHVQRQVLGPKGGRKWVPLSEESDAR